MWKAVNSPLGIGVLGGAGGNALWAAISNIAALKPYLPAITAPVIVPMWAVVAVSAIALIVLVRSVMAWNRHPVMALADPTPAFTPNETETAVVVMLRAHDQVLPESEIVHWIVEHAPDHIGRQDVRLAIKSLVSAGWLSVHRATLDQAGYALTPRSLAFAKQHSVKPLRTGYH